MKKKYNPVTAGIFTRTAVVLAGFLFVFIIVIVAEYWRGRYSSILESQELEQYQEELKMDPSREEVKERIREKDLELRKEFFRRQALLDKGRYIIIAAAVLLLICVKYLMSLEPKLPKKKKKE